MLRAQENVARLTSECESANEVSAGFGGMAEQTTELITRLKLEVKELKVSGAAARADAADKLEKIANWKKVAASREAGGKAAVAAAHEVRRCRLNPRNPC